MISPLERIKLTNSPSPLSLYLSLYNKAAKECYIDNMQGARLLKNWLGKIEYPIEKYPQILASDFSIPHLLESYEMQQLAMILSDYKKNKDLNQLAIASKAIYFTSIELNHKDI